MLASDGVCAGLIPEISAGVGAINYAIGGGKHALDGYAKAMLEGLVVGLGAAACALICPEAGGAAVRLGAAVMYLGAAVGAVDYYTSTKHRTWGGFWQAFALDAIENGPYPVDRILGFAK